MKTLRDSGIEWAEAWRHAHPETVGNIVLHALREIKGAADWTAGKDELRKKRSLRENWAFEFVSSYTGGAVGGGDYFVFGLGIQTGQYRTIPEALNEAKRVSGNRPLDVHVVLMRELSRVLVERAGELAVLEKIN